MRPAKQRLIDAGYTVWKSAAFPARSLKRFVARTAEIEAGRMGNPYLVNSLEEMNELADKLLVRGRS